MVSLSVVVVVFSIYLFRFKFFLYYFFLAEIWDTLCGDRATVHSQVNVKERNSLVDACIWICCCCCCCRRCLWFRWQQLWRVVCARCKAYFWSFGIMNANLLCDYYWMANADQIEFWRRFVVFVLFISNGYLGTEICAMTTTATRSCTVKCRNCQLNGSTTRRIKIEHTIDRPTAIGTDGPIKCEIINKTRKIHRLQCKWNHGTNGSGGRGKAHTQALTKQWQTHFNLFIFFVTFIGNDNDGDNNNNNKTASDKKKNIVNF